MHRRSAAARPTTIEFQTINCLLTRNMRSMHSVRKTRQTAVLLLLFAIGLDVARVSGQDEYMTCSRPIKQSRTSKQINLPCEGMEQGKESWCNLPGPMYPWHAVRNFVFENQGLMRRMYGEVRQLSLLRMEFAGESNTLDETGSGRDFNDVFQPMLSTSLGPTPATTSTLVSMLSAPEHQDADTDEADGDGDYSAGMEAESGASATAATSTTEATPLISIANADDDVNNVSDGGSNERFTTLADENEMGSTTHDMLHDGLLMDTAPTDETLTTPIMDEDFASSEEDGLVIILQPPSPSPSPSTSSNDSTQSVSKNGEPAEPVTVTKTNDRVSSQESIEGKNRIDNHILFQDFERNSPQPQAASSPSPSPSLSPPPPPPAIPAASSSTVEESRVRSRIGVNACPVKEEVVAPYWANNTRGEILALLNLYPFEQYIHWEKCTNEHRQMYCRDGCRCEQQYRLHRLLAFDPSNECRGIFSDWFRFPSCCVCKCYFDEMPGSERISFNRSPRIIDPLPQSIQDLDGPDVNGVDDSHFFYKYHHSFRHPRK